MNLIFPAFFVLWSIGWTYGTYQVWTKPDDFMKKQRESQSRVRKLLPDFWPGSLSQYENNDPNTEHWWNSIWLYRFAAVGGYILIMIFGFLLATGRL